MTFTYERTIASYYSELHDERFEDTYDFDYEPEREEVLDAIVSFLIEENSSNENLNENEYRTIFAVLKETIEINDLQDQLESHYYDRLKEYFEEDALASERCD